MQADESKVKALESIFGGDITASVIRTVLTTNENKFDEAVDSLLNMSNNSVHNEPRKDEDLDEETLLERKEREKIKTLENMFGSDLSNSVICTVLESNKGELVDTVDTLLNMTSKEINPTYERPTEVSNRENERLKQEEELKNYGEFKALQIKLQEEEARAIREEQARRLAEDQRLQAEAATLKEQEERRRLEMVQEQERLLREYEAQKKVQEEEHARREQEVARRRELEQKKKHENAHNREEAAAQQRAKLAEEKRLADEEEYRREQERLKQAWEAKLALIKREEEALRAEEAKRKLEEEARRRELLLQEETLRRRAKEQEARLLKLREEEEVRLEEKRLQLNRAEQQAREEAARVQEELKNEREAQARLKKQLEREDRQRIEAEDRAYKQKIEEEHRAQLRRLEEERMTEAQKRLLEEERLDLQKERQLIEEMRKEKELKLRRKLEAKLRKEEEEKRARELEEKLRLEALRQEEEQKLLEEKEEEERRKAEQERLQQEEEEQRRREQETLRLKREEEEQARLAAAKEEAERVIEEELRKKIAYDQIAASAVFIPPKAAVPAENTIAVTADVAGDVVTCAWDLPEGNATATNWLGLYPVHQPFNTKKYVQFAYTNGVSTGEHVFRGVTPGHYEARFFTTRGYEHAARSSTVLVGPAATLVVQLQGEHLLVHYTLDPKSSTPTREWVGVYEKTQRRNKLYLSTAYGNAEGQVLMKAPRSPGTYEVRLFAAGAVYNDQARVEFVVEDNDCILVEQPSVAAGGNINVSWILRTLEPSTGDWIGLYHAEEANNSNYLSSTYTQGVSGGTTTIQAPSKDGVYEFRLFSRNKGKYVTFRTSQPLHVTAPIEQQ